MQSAGEVRQSEQLRAEAGSDLDAKLSFVGRTAAHFAAQNGQAAALKFLHEVPL